MKADVSRRSKSCHASSAPAEINEACHAAALVFAGDKLARCIATKNVVVYTVPVAENSYTIYKVDQITLSQIRVLGQHWGRRINFCF